MSDSRKKATPIWKRSAARQTVLWLVVIAVIIAGTRFYTPGAEPEATGNAGNQDIVTDIPSFAEEQYSSTVVPAIEENAQDLSTLLKALSADAEAAGEEYGHKAGDSPWSFPVTVTGTIGDASFGEVALDVDDLADVTVGVQTGPAIKGTAIRDAVGTITFGMFENQTAFAQAATELNNQVKANVFTKYDLATMQGQQVTIIGAFTYDDPTHILITPVDVEVK